MLGQHRWMIGVATSTSILGLTVTSGLVMLANRLVDEFSHPHDVQNPEQFDLGLPRTEPEPPRMYQRPLTFRTSDGTLLCGDFWAQPRPAPTIVMCHGYRASRAQLRHGAAIEYKSGYNVLLFDFRGHGDSDSVITSGGNAEVRDLEAAIAAARMQPETLPNRIIIHGFSMGAATALLTPPQREVAAIIADSPFARSDDVLRRLMRHRLTSSSKSWGPLLHRLRLRILFPAAAWITVAMTILVFRLRFGHTYVARPDTSFKRWMKQAKKVQEPHSIPSLLIHALGDELIPFAHAQQLVAKAQAHGVAIETYFVDHPSHCGAYMHDPEQYTAVIQDFLFRHLKGDFPSNKRAK